MARSFSAFSLSSTHLDVEELNTPADGEDVSMSWGFPIDAPLWGGAMASVFSPGHSELLRQRRVCSLPGTTAEMRGWAPRTVCHPASPVLSATPTNGLSHNGGLWASVPEIQQAEDARELEETATEGYMARTLLTDFRCPWE
ncbi:hypothetical protein STCU_09909 [Strigomonas culicis]|uniref:Uncharacterized protein n=1 Tax=Strigomonas culicis TaxID=28005 RepID=S9UV99_9TRYP|nr:hypothetical protein STCU_09909 [Strigomonas culicis]|eukprot:EPY18441.1 hypothetical protein STCU_09909 [Strigomonas culicis]